MDRLFPVEDVKRKPQPRPVRALKGHDRLCEITFGTQKQYIRAMGEAQALGWWMNGHPALTVDDARIREYPQEELDRLVEVDPTLAGRLHQL